MKYTKADQEHVKFREWLLETEINHLLHTRPMWQDSGTSALPALSTSTMRSGNYKPSSQDLTYNLDKDELVLDTHCLTLCAQ